MSLCLCCFLFNKISKLCKGACKELLKEKIRYIQSIASTFLYYARALDFTMLMVLNDVATIQAKPTTKTLQECQQLIDYAATYL